VTAFTRVYSDAERAAVEHAHADVRIRPLAKICRMAAVGELREPVSGELVPAFEIPVSSARYIGKRAERRKAGRVTGALDRLPARDRAANLQARLTGVIELEMERVENAQRRQPSAPLDPEHLRKLARALRELATVPDPSEQRLPRAPGESTSKGVTPDGASRDNLAGAILAASDASVSPSIRNGSG
jgi:hypothetical protein